MFTQRSIRGRACVLGVACLALGWWGAGPARAGFATASGILTEANFVAPSGQFPAFNIPMTPNVYVPLGGQDPAAGVVGQMGIAFSFTPGTDVLGIAVQPGSFLQVGALTSPPTAAALFAEFSISYLADGFGVSTISPAGITVAGNIPIAGGYAVFTAQINYALGGQPAFASQTLSYNTMTQGPAIGAFSVPLSAPAVAVNVPPGQTLTLTGFVRYDVGSASVTAPPALGEPEPVPEPAGWLLLAAGAPVLLGWARRRRFGPF